MNRHSNNSSYGEKFLGLVECTVFLFGCEKQ
jgi:hypothetical protein